MVPFLHLSEGKTKITEGIFEGKLSLISDVNSGSFWYEAEVPYMGWNFLFILFLFGFCAMLLTHDIYN